MLSLHVYIPMLQTSAIVNKYGLFRTLLLANGCDFTLHEEQILIYWTCNGRCCRGLFTWVNYFSHTITSEVTFQEMTKVFWVVVFWFTCQTGLRSHLAEGLFTVGSNFMISFEGPALWRLWLHKHVYLVDEDTRGLWPFKRTHSFSQIFGISQDNIDMAGGLSHFCDTNAHFSAKFICDELGNVEHHVCVRIMLHCAQISHSRPSSCDSGMRNTQSKKWNWLEPTLGLLI